MDTNSFDEVIQIIETSRSNAYQKVNEELILMYQRIGKYLSDHSQNASYGDSYIDSLSKHIQERFPGIKGFTRRGLYRMKQFYELYADNDIVSPLVTQLSWTNHLIIMSSCKSNEEREFYIKLAIKEHYSKRQLERQIDSGYYERYMLSKEKLLPESIPAELLFIKRCFYDKEEQTDINNYPNNYYRTLYYTNKRLTTTTGSRRIVCGMRCLDAGYT